VNCVFDAMTDAPKNGEGIEVRGLGSFTVRQYKPYDGRTRALWPLTPHVLPLSGSRP
jgi:integration host factor subunit beta